MVPGKSLDNRSGAPPPTDWEKVLAALRDALTVARAVEPDAKSRHCLDCFRRGRNAGLQAFEDAVNASTRRGLS